MRKDIIVKLIFHCNVEDKKFEELTIDELRNGLNKKISQLLDKWDSSAFEYVAEYPAMEIPTVEKLEEKYPHGYPVYTFNDWKYEVTSGYTKLGYYEWVRHQLESNADDQQGEIDYGSCVIKHASSGKWLVYHRNGVIIATGYPTKEQAMAFADGWTGNRKGGETACTK